jgi:hypothetical protein
MIVETSWCRWEYDLEGSRVSFVEKLAEHPPELDILFQPDGRPKCYALAEVDGWAACTTLPEPVVGEKLGIVFHTGERIGGSRITQIEGT